MSFQVECNTNFILTFPSCTNQALWPSRPDKACHVSTIVRSWLLSPHHDSFDPDSDSAGRSHGVTSHLCIPVKNALCSCVLCVWVNCIIVCCVLSHICANFYFRFVINWSSDNRRPVWSGICRQRLTFLKGCIYFLLRLSMQISVLYHAVKVITVLFSPRQ